jgi:hypothetical protein
MTAGGMVIKTAEGLVTRTAKNEMNKRAGITRTKEEI